MIFSTEKCPLCQEKLQLEILEPAQGKVAFRYYCLKRELTRNHANTHTVASPHYENRCFQGGQLAEMIFPPFTLYHSEYNKMTSVYSNGIREPNKLIFRIPLLDADYGEPHTVLTRLKLLVTFS